MSFRKQKNEDEKSYKKVPIDPIRDEIHQYAATLSPDFEDCATNYFQDEPSVKAGIQLQKDAWNAAVDVIVAYIKQKNLVQVEVIERFKL